MNEGARMIRGICAATANLLVVGLFLYWLGWWTGHTGGSLWPGFISAGATGALWFGFMWWLWRAVKPIGEVTDPSAKMPATSEDSS